MNNHKILLSILMQIFCANAVWTQSWLQGRCIRVDTVKVKKITAYVFEEARNKNLTYLIDSVVVDSLSKVRETEIFNEKGQIIESSNHSNNDGTLTTSFYSYDAGKSNRVQVQNQSKVFEERTYKYLDNNLIKITTSDLNGKTTDDFFIQKDGMGNIICTYRLGFRLDTINVSYFKYDENNKCIYYSSYHNGRRNHAVHTITNDKGVATNKFFINPDGTIKEKHAVSESSYKGKRIESISITKETGETQTDTVVFDVYGNIVKLILDDPKKERIIIWYYTIDYNN